MSDFTSSRVGGETLVPCGKCSVRTSADCQKCNGRMFVFAKCPEYKPDEDRKRDSVLDPEATDSMEGGEKDKDPKKDQDGNDGEKK